MADVVTTAFAVAAITLVNAPLALVVADAKAATVYQGVQAIQPEDIANTVLWVSQQPAHVNINSIEIMPVAQTFGPLQISRR